MLQHPPHAAAPDAAVSEQQAVVLLVTFFAMPMHAAHVCYAAAAM